MKKIIWLLFIVLTLSACSSKSYSSNGVSAPMATPAPAAGISRSSKENEKSESYLTDSGYSTASSADQIMPEMETPAAEREEKKIVTGNMNMETNQFDYVIDMMREITINNGGYVQSSNSYVYGMSDKRQLKAGSVTLRIPAENYSEAKKQIEALGKVNNSSESTDDATATYYDTEARLIRKQAEEQRLLEMIKDAKKLEDLIELEKRLAEVRADIEIYQSRMLNIDRLSSYSTLNVSLTEVSDEVLTIVSEDLPSRIRNSFIKSFNQTVSFFENAIVFLAGIIVPLGIIAVIVLIVLFITKKAIGKKQSH